MNESTMTRMNTNRMHAYVHTYIHTYTHAHIHTCTLSLASFFVFFFFTHARTQVLLFPLGKAFVQDGAADSGAKIHDYGNKL